jgi:hypothetical protein
MKTKRVQIVIVGSVIRCYYKVSSTECQPWRSEIPRTENPARMMYRIHTHQAGWQLRPQITQPDRMC